MTDTLPQASLLGGTPPPVYPWPPPLGPAFGQPWPPPPTENQGSALVWTQIGGQCRTTLGFTPPAKPDPKFIRAQFCGTRNTGLTWLPGMAGKANPDGTAPLVMDLDSAKYGPDDTVSQDKFIAAKVRDGNTHVQISLGDFAGLGWSIAQTVAYGLRLRARGISVDLWVLNGGGAGSPWAVRDVMWAQIKALVTPWIQAFIDAGVITKDNGGVCLGWQLDGNASGTSLVDCAIGLGNLVRGKVLYYAAHWLRDGNAWWDDGTCKTYHICDRFSFWAFMLQEGLLNLTYPQGDVNAPISAPDAQGGPNGGAQGMLRDVARAMKDGQQFIAPAEYAAQDAFNDPKKIPAWSQNARGFGWLCAGPAFVGYYNGGTYSLGMVI